VIDSLKAYDRAFLHLDLGDFSRIDDVVGDYLTRVIWDSYEKMDVKAVALGPREISSWILFRELTEDGSIPVVSSNVTIRKDGTEVPAGNRTLVLEVNGIRVGLFSLMGGSEFSSATIPAGWDFGFHDPFTVAAGVVSELRKDADVVVLMSQMRQDDTERLIQSVPGIDVALYGNRPRWQQTATRIGDTIVNQTGTRGQHLGRLVLIVDPKGSVIDFGSQNASLGRDFPDNPRMREISDEVTRALRELRREAREQRRRQMDEKRLSSERFIGAEMCRRCHERQYAQWKGTPHASAFATLEQPVEGKPLTPACVSCHVTGYGQEGGFQSVPGDPGASPSRQPDLADVQCEACHGQGSLHTRTGNARVEEGTCRACHDQEWSPDFDFRTAVAAVSH